VSYSGVLENLGKAFKLCLRQAPKMSSVTGEGIRLGKEAIENVPEGLWGHKHCLASLGACYRDRFSKHES